MGQGNQGSGSGKRSESEGAKILSAGDNTRQEIRQTIIKGIVIGGMTIAYGDRPLPLVFPKGGGSQTPWHLVLSVLLNILFRVLIGVLVAGLVSFLLALPFWPPHAITTAVFFSTLGALPLAEFLATKNIRAKTQEQADALLGTCRSLIQQWLRSMEDLHTRAMYKGWGGAQESLWELRDEMLIIQSTLKALSERRSSVGATIFRWRLTELQLLEALKNLNPHIRGLEDSAEEKGAGEDDVVERIEEVKGFLKKLRRSLKEAAATQ